MSKKVTITISGHEYELRLLTRDEFDRRLLGENPGLIGLPTFWCHDSDTIKVWPLPLPGIDIQVDGRQWESVEWCGPARGEQTSKRS
jgi:hypothetical protein